MVRLILIILLFYAEIAMAQYSTEIINRKTKLECLKKIDEFVMLSSPRNDEEINAFKQLFTSENSIMPNLIMPANNMNQEVIVEDYISLKNRYHSIPITNRAMPYKIELESKDEIQHSGIASVYVNLISSSISKDDNIQYDDTFDVKFELAYNYSIKEVLIDKIQLTHPIGKYIVIVIKEKGVFYEKEYIKVNDDYKVKGVWSKQKPFQDSLIVNKSKILTHQEGVYIIKNTQKHDVFFIKPMSSSYLNKKVIKAKEGYSNPEKGFKRNISFRKSIFFVEPYWSFVSLTDKTIISSDIGSMNYNHGTLNEFGLKLGINVVSNDKGYLAFAMDISSSYLKNAFQFTPQISIYEQIDPDDYKYERTSLISEINENHTINYQSISLHVEKGIIVYKKYGAYINLSGAYAFNYNGIFTNNAKAEYSGYYKDLYGLTIKENGVYDFGTYQLSNTSELKFKQTNMILGFGGGLYRNISNRFSIKAGVHYSTSTDNIYENKVANISTNKGELNSAILSSNGNNKLNFLFIQLGLNIKL